MKSYRVNKLPFLAVGLVLISSLTAQAQIFNFPGDLNTSASDASDFTFGTKVSPDSMTLTPFDTQATFGNIGVLFNSASPDGMPEINLMPQSGMIALLPGDGLDCVMRLTIPTTGLYDVDALFTDVSGSSTSDVHIVLNGTSLFDGYVDAENQGGSAQYLNNRLPLNLTAGDMLDFVVGSGDDGNVNATDSIALEATLSALPDPEVPEPRAYALLGCGIVLLAAATRLRRASGFRA